MSEIDITSKIEDIVSKILSRKYNAHIKIKLVDPEDKGNDKGRNHRGTSVAGANARKRDK